MIKNTITISKNQNLEKKPIALLVQLASQFESSIHIASEDSKVNAKSIMGMMTLKLSTGSTLELIVDGIDEDTAMSQLNAYFA